MRDLSSASVAAITRYSPRELQLQLLHELDVLHVLARDLRQRDIQYVQVLPADEGTAADRAGLRRPRETPPGPAAECTGRVAAARWAPPFTTANGISACCGGRNRGSRLRRRVGDHDPQFRLLLHVCSGAALSVGAQMHGAPDFVQGLAREPSRALVGALGDDPAPPVSGLSSNSWARAGACRRSPPRSCRSAAACIPGSPIPALRQPWFTHLRGAVVGIDLVQIPHRTLLRVARIGAPARAPGSVFMARSFLHYLIGLFAQPDGVCRRTSTSCGHPAPATFGRRGEQHLRLPAGSSPPVPSRKPQQPLAIGHRDAVVCSAPAPWARCSDSVSPVSWKLAAQLPVSWWCCVHRGSSRRASAFASKSGSRPVEVV